MTRFQGLPYEPPYKPLKYNEYSIRSQEDKTNIGYQESTVNSAEERCRLPDPAKIKAEREHYERLRWEEDFARSEKRRMKHLLWVDH